MSPDDENYAEYCVLFVHSRAIRIGAHEYMSRFTMAMRTIGETGIYRRHSEC